MAKLQQVIDLLVKAQFDKRDKEVLKGEIKDAFNQSVELDEESLRNIVSALNRVLGSVGKELNIDELIKMPSVDAWKKLGEVAGTTFVDAFNSSLQGIDNKSMQAVIEILQDIRNNQGVKIELFNKENLDAAMQSINNISAAVDKLVSNAHGKYYKTTEEINEALERSKNKIKDIEDALNYKSPVKAKYGGFEKVIDIYNEYMSKKGNSPWEEEYAALTKFMTAFSAFESKRKKDPDWIRNLEKENMWAKYKPMAELYKSRIGGEKERRSMLTDVINANNGINRASEPWAQEHTLIEVRDLLKNGLTVKETKKPTKEVVESQPKEGVESQPKENSKPQVSPTKKVAEDELMTLIRQLAGATKEGNNTQIENIDKEIINRYSEPIQKFIKNLLEDFDIGENDKQLNSAMSDLYKKLQSYDTVDAAANKKAFEINKENLTTLFKTLYRLNSFVENSKKNGVPEKKYSLSNSYVQKLTDFVANEDLIDQKKIGDIYNLIDELYDAPKENVKSIVEKLVNKTLEAIIAPQTSAKSETLIENKTPINKEIILDENLTAKLNALTDAISSLAQNELNTLIDIIKSFQVKEDDSNNDINKLIQALISNQSDNERGAFLNSKSGKYIGFIEGDQDSVSASMDDYKQAAKQGYDTRIHSHTFLTAAPSVTGKANDIQNWINTFDYIKKHIIATQKELLSVDLSGLRKKQVEEIKEAYLAKAEPLMEAAPNNETLQLQLRQAFESVLKEKGLSNIMTSYKLNDVIADNFTKQSNGDIQSTINASIDPASLKEAISDLAKDNTITEAKNEIISAITGHTTSVDDPKTKKEIKQETGNQASRFERIQNIASDYEDVDDVEAAIKQFGEVYKRIVLMSDDSYKYIKPDKTGINILRKIATDDSYLNDFSGIEFQRVEKPSTTTTQVSTNNTDIVNAIGEVKEVIEKFTPQSENPVDNHTVVDGTINVVSPSEANQIAQESTLKNIFDVLKQKNDSISEKEISQNENKPDETPIETKPVESLDVKKEKVDIEKVLQEITALTKKELITRNIRGTMDDVGLNQDSVYYGNSDIDNIIQKLEYSKSYLKKFDDPSTKKLISNFDDIIGLVASFQKDRDILKNKYNNNEISIDELDHNNDLVHFAGVFNDSVSDLMTNLPSPYDFQDRIKEILSDFTSEDYAEMAKIVETAFDASVQKVAKIREELSAAKNELEDIQKISETYGYTSTMSAREAGRINSTLEKPVNKNVPNYSRNKYVIKMLKDGSLPQKYSDGYGFSNNDGSYYKITKTEYDYAVYLQETIAKLNVGFDEGLQILKSQNGQLEAAIKKVNELEIAENAAVQEQDAAYERQAIVHNNLAHIESNKEESEARKENIEVTKKIETTVVNEAAAHRENADAIAAENNAIEKNILLLKEKAKQMSLSEWQESNQRGSELFAAKYDLYKAGHKEVITDDFWRQTQYEKPVNYTPISLEKASEILYDKISQSIYDGWYRNADSEYKPKIEASILGDDEIRNASLNNMWHAYEDFIGKSIDFFEFLNTEIPVYRGKNSENFTEDDTFISFSFDENIAKKFGDTVIQTLIKPIETLGNLSRSGEYEVMVPRESIAAYDNIPNGVKIDYSNPNDENAQQILAVTNARKEEAEAHRENEAAIKAENNARKESIDINKLFYAAKYPETHPRELETALADNPNLIAQVTSKRDSLKERLRPVQEMTNRISRNASVKDIPYDDLSKEAVSAAKTLSTMYDEGITDSEEYVTLQYKILNIFDKMAQAAGGVSGSSAKSRVELNTWIARSIKDNTGFDIIQSKAWDVLWSQLGISVLDSSTGKKRNMRTVAGNILGYKNEDGISGDAFTESDFQTVSDIDNILKALEKIKEETAAHRENEAAIIGENEARREGQAIENADNAQSNISEIRAETIETTNRTVAQNELNAAMEREPEQTPTTGDMPITSISLVPTNTNEASETNDMTTLLTAVQAVTEAVKLKTRAFNTERSAVQLVVEDEVKALDVLENKLISIKQTLERLMNNVGTGASDLVAGLNNVNINVNYQKTNTDVGNVLATENTLKKILDVVQKTSNSKKQSKSSNKNNSSTKTNSDYKKSTKEDYRGSNWFPDKLKSRIGDLAKFRAQLMTTGKLTDEIDAQIYELVNAMNQVKSGPDLSIWNEKFHQLRTKVGIDKIFDDASDKEDIKIYKELIALKQLEYSIEKKYIKAKDGSVEKQYYENQLTTLRQVITSQNIIKTNDEYELKLAKMKEDHERELGAIKAQQTDADNKEEIKSVENLIDLYKKLGETIAQRNHAATQEARNAWQQVINAQVAGIRNNPYNTPENRGQFIAAVNKGRNTKDLSLSVQDAKKQGNARVQQEKIDAAQREAEVVRQLVELYKQLGEAQARQNTSLFSQEEADAAKLEAERLRKEIKAKRFDSIDYATDMKFKVAKQSGFDATTTKATKEKESAALKEQETIIKRIVGLYKELGNYQAQAENLDGQEADFWQAKADEIKEKIIEEKQLLTAFANLDFNQLSQQFEETRKKSKYKKEDSIFLKSLNLEDKTQQNDAKKLLKNYEKLGKLQASFDQTGNLKTQEEIKQLQQIIDSEQQRLGLTQQQITALESRKNVIYKENQELLQAQEREKARKATLKQQLKDAQAEANKNKANSALSSGREAISNIGVTIDTNKMSADTTAKIGQLSKEIETLNGLYKSVRDAQNPSDVEKYSQALIDQTAKVKKLTAEVNGLTNEYSELQGDNIKEIGINTLGDKANISDYEDQLTKAVRAAYGAKATITGFDADTKRLSFTVKKGAHEFVNYEAAIRNGDNALVSIQGTAKRTETFLQAITRKTKEIFTYFSGSSIIYKAINEVQKGIQYVRDIDIALTELKKVTDETEESYDKFLKTAAKTADKVGSTIKEVVSSTADFARLGYSMEDAAQMAENAQLLMNVSEFTDISSATDTLISAVQAFSYTADETLHVVDILNKIGNNYAISTADLASSLTRSSAALVAAGGTLEEAVALTAAANAIIQDADSVGNALKVVSMRIRGTSTKE